MVRVSSVSLGVWVLGCVLTGCTDASQPADVGGDADGDAGTGSGAGGALAGNDAAAGGDGDGDGGGDGDRAPLPGSDAAVDARDAGMAARGTGPGDWAAGDYPDDATAATFLDIADVPGQQGLVRQFKVHVPPGYDAQNPMPLVFCIHGLGQDAVSFCVNGADMLPKSDAAGFILVMPNGYQNSWNGGTCCGGASTMQLDDVALMRAIFEEVGAHLNVDLDRVYATGLSNGGYMSYRLACEAADIFAAVAPGAGAVGINAIGGGTNAVSDFTECKPSMPVSVLDLHGTADGLVSYALQAPSVAVFADAAGCAASSSPASAPPSAGDTECVSRDGCGDGIDVTACTVTGGGHVWFGNESCGTGAGPAGCGFVGQNSEFLVNTDAAWDFFAAHSR